MVSRRFDLLASDRQGSFLPSQSEIDYEEDPQLRNGEYSLSLEHVSWGNRFYWEIDPEEPREKDESPRCSQA